MNTTNDGSGAINTSTVTLVGVLVNVLITVAMCLKEIITHIKTSECTRGADGAISVKVDNSDEKA
jgi:hypothetical protein